MKIVSWNCGEATSKEIFSEEKAAYIDDYAADIYVIQECTENDVKNLNKFKKNKKFYCDKPIIDSPYGIGIFSDKFNIELLSDHNPEFRYFLPYRIFNHEFEFALFAVWTKGKDKNNKDVEYTVQTWGAINHEPYKKYLNGPIILIGDFNSNNYWDKDYKSNKEPSHNDIIEKLREYNIESAYHKYYNCINGNEKEPTEFYLMDENKKYHVDYCFASGNFSITDVKVGSLAEWRKTKYSDHCPISIDLKV